jgi:hypothetical protein
MDYQAAGFWLSCAALLLSLVAMVCAAVVWFNRRDRVTIDAINRVEARADTSNAGLSARVVDMVNAAELRASAAHAETASRVIALETEFRHVLTTETLNGALSELFVLVRASEARQEKLDAKLQHVADTLNTLVNKIIDKGMAA